MPYQLPKPCKHPGCPNLDCTEHKQRINYRPSPRKLGYTARWERFRLMKLRSSPVCEDCGRPATQVHHIIKKKDGGLDTYENTLSLCASCHSKRTAKGE